MTEECNGRGNQDEIDIEVNYSGKLYKTRLRNKKNKHNILVKSIFLYQRPNKDITREYLTAINL